MSHILFKPFPYKFDGTSGEAMETVATIEPDGLVRFSPDVTIDQMKAAFCNLAKSHARHEKQNTYITVPAPVTYRTDQTRPVVKEDPQWLKEPVKEDTIKETGEQPGLDRMVAHTAGLNAALKVMDDQALWLRDPESRFGRLAAMEKIIKRYQELVPVVAGIIQTEVWCVEARSTISSGQEQICDIEFIGRTRPAAGDFIARQKRSDYPTTYFAIYPMRLDDGSPFSVKSEQMEFFVWDGCGWKNDQDQPVSAPSAAGVLALDTLGICHRGEALAKELGFQNASVLCWFDFIEAKVRGGAAAKANRIKTLGEAVDLMSKVKEKVKVVTESDLRDEANFYM